MMQRLRLGIGMAFVFLLAFTGVVGRAQELDSAQISKIDDYVNAAMAEWSIPGLSLAIVRGDEIAYMQGYGQADTSGRSVTPQTPFWLASLSKSITATAIMQLVEAGQIDLDAPVQTYIPWFREGMNDPTPITIRHLLNQSAGFTLFSGREILSDGDESDTALENNVRRLSSSPLQFEPGAYFGYSNSNYDILGYVVQVVSGQVYEDYITEHIFTPLEMSHSYTRLRDAEGITEGYLDYFRNITPVAIPFSRATTPSAGLISSAEDLAHYVIAHLNDGVYKDTVLVSPEGIQNLHTPGIQLSPYDHYGMGWFLSPFWNAIERSADGENYTLPAIIQHDGLWANFRNFITLVPRESLGVITLMNTNVTEHESAFGGVANNIVLLALGYEPAPVSIFEDAFQQNSLWIAIALVIIWILRLISAVLTLRHWQRFPESRPRTLPQIAVKVLLPALIDVALLIYLLTGLPAQFVVPLHTLMAFNPDLALLIQVLLVLAGGWGLMRTVLFAAMLWRNPVRTPVTA
jgi:CubicO group peptidase (beta-lactamase class C family)